MKRTIKFSLKKSLIFSHMMIAALSVSILAVSISNISKSILQNKVLTMVNSLLGQYKYDVESYMADIEDVVSMIFLSEDTYGYSPEDSKLSEYDRIQKNADITNRLLQLSIMDNFADFVIVYPDNSTNGGAVSSHSQKLFDGNMYETAKEYIENGNGNSVWFTGYKGDYKRMYYVKTLNKNAIILCSVYTQELNSIFDSTMDDLTVQIIDSNDRIMFSTNRAEKGESVEEDKIKLLQANENSAFVANGQLISNIKAVNDWDIVASIPTKSILSELSTIRYASLALTVFCCALAMILGIVFANVFIRPIQKLLRKIEAVKDGDLTVSAEQSHISDLNDMADGFNVMVDTIRGILTTTVDVSQMVLKDSEEINEIAALTMASSRNVSTAMEDIADGSSKQLNESQNTMELLEQLSENIGKTNGYVQDVEAYSKAAMETGTKSMREVEQLQANTGATKEMMDKVVTTFDHLREQIQKVESVVGVIQSISEETNLLALNASIEAARAGEAGRGFAVVAGEVMKLAKQTEDSTNNVHHVVGDINAYVDETVRVIEESKRLFDSQGEIVFTTSRSFEEIIESTQSIGDKIGEIRAMADVMTSLKEQSLQATNEVLIVTENASANTEEVLSVTEEEATNMQILSSKSKEMNETAIQLKKTLEEFHI